MKPATMAARAAAVILDAVLVLVVLGPLVALAAGEWHRSGGSVGFHLHGWAALAWVVLSLAYWTVCERLWGMTIGKRLFSIRVEADGGGRPGWGRSAARNLLRPVDAFPWVLPYLLGFVVASASAERRRIGDRVAGTRVAHR